MCYTSGSAGRFDVDVNSIDNPCLYMNMSEYIEEFFERI